MKIGKKLIISNIIITTTAMIILSILISNIVSNYIENDIKKDIIKENKTIIKLLSYNKFLEYNNNKISVNLDYFKKTQKLPVLTAVFNVNEKPELINTSTYFSKNIIPNEELETMYNQSESQVYEIKIWNKSFLAYNESVEVNLNGHKYTLLVTTLISNENVNKIINQIVYVLIIAIVCISILIVLINRYSERMITRPINVLVNITKKIALKHFDEKVDLHTGDEFETLAVSINNMAESLNKQDIEQKKFYENISHELKTPLTVISGYAQGIKTNIFEDNDKALDTIVEVSTQLKKQLEDVIYLSKLDTINEYYNFKDTSINELICNVLDKLDSIIILNEIDIIYEPINDIVISIDKEKISRMLTNVLSNCLKYTKDTIEIKTEVEKNWLKISVLDNGKGFNQKLMKNPFSGTMVGEKEGSGIGLSIIKKIIDGHKGKLSLSNTKNGGAMYIIYLPIK
ncbi:ATP-binding protein (plasmid) [Haloimpatiens sp. FM7330]|uniref:HAMP domain-containing sensor histidine kinase n=1 Tax=Haloimpatiens sp. FM7330 TaxID=3298610 RepID=UPI00363B590A